ncbi:MAG: hypothetical protein GEV28_26370 [Actinophytocola sp.]|uniref:DUF6186 family protein n=1 Tax=Actinophytocola sp. TaxID=1872138 RepID=UPI0013224BD6|nr:DUF6186 family protein [Actinophytocola sp.]MPZ83725.1 hypothetical protein [Actinophytocola sp.]
MHALTVTVFALLGGAFVVLELLGRRENASTPTVRKLLGATVHNRPALVLLVLTWWWFGWHFFVTGG